MKWDDMTPEERESYVNQDVVEADPREIPGSDKLEHVIGKHGVWADLFLSGGYLNENSKLYKQVDPLEVECLRLYYGEGMSYAKIAEHLEIQHLSCGRVIKSRKLTKHIVHKLLRSGKDSLMRIYNRDDSTKQGE